MKKNIILIISIVFVVFSCEDYLDKVPEAEGMEEEEVFSNFQNFRMFCDKVYQDMHNYLSQGDYTYIAAITDEGYLEPGWDLMPNAQKGNWMPLVEGDWPAGAFGGVWKSWRSIRIANMVLANLHYLEGNATQTQIDYLKGQAHFMRAWYYYEFLKRWGGMPYIEKPFKATDNFALPRLSRHETAMKIAADCDTAFNLLPLKWDDANIGRPEKGSAKALKAGAYLISASPQYNPTNDQSRWELVAQAAWDAIEFAQSTRRYNLLEGNGLDTVIYMTPSGVKSIEYKSGFDSIFMYLPYNDEIMWECYPAIVDNMYNVFAVPSIAAGGIIQGFNVSANIVNRFETVNGLAIEDDRSFDPQNPYINRDPRFYHSILFNQQRWTSQNNRYLELWNGGKDRLPDQHYNRSGYLARKFWAPERDQFSGLLNPFNHCIYFRLAEMYLIYAEAANELGGPTYKIDEANITALEAINIVRERAGVPPVNSIYLSTKDDFRERIRNERTVELFLEGKRIFDLMRWGVAHEPEYKELYSVEFTHDDSKPTGFHISISTTPFHKNVFEQRQYSWPIPTNDAYMFEEFEQNPGW
jgi:hypothetical protein